MQSRKASNSKKTNKNADEVIVNENSVIAAEVKAKPRASKSSQSKKEVSAEVSSARNHRKSTVGAAAIPASEGSLVKKTLPVENDTPKVMAASAGVGFESIPSDAVIIDPVGVVVAVENDVVSQHSREDVANLAYSYWIARGYSHGYADEDWLRAETELAGKR